MEFNYKYSFIAVTSFDHFVTDGMNEKGLSFGILFKIFFISSINPMSSILSASSNTANLTLLRFKLPLHIRSSTLPGVPIITCGFYFKSLLF